MRGVATRKRLWQPPRIRTGTVPAARLPQRHLCRPAHQPPRRRLLADRMRTPPFPCSRCGSRAASRRTAATRLATGSQNRRCFAAIPGPAPAAARRYGMIITGARVAAVERGACRQAPGVRAHPARYGRRRFFPQRHHGGRHAVRHPHCASLFRWQPSRPPPLRHTQKAERVRSERTWIFRIRKNPSASIRTPKRRAPRASLRGWAQAFRSAQNPGHQGRHGTPPLPPTHAAPGPRCRAVAPGHANASDTRAGGLPPLSCPLPTARLQGRLPVIRPS